MKNIFTKEVLNKMSKSKLGNKNPNYAEGLDKYRSRKWLYQKYIIEDKSIKELSELANIGVGAIFKWLKKNNIPNKPRGSRKGKLHHMWKGGRYRTTQGYILIYYPKNHSRKEKGKYVKEHVLVVEKNIGRSLNKEETVHHIDGVKNNNVNKNLYLFSSESEHQRYHRLFKYNKVDKITRSNIVVNEE